MTTAYIRSRDSIDPPGLHGNVTQRPSAACDSEKLSEVPSRFAPTCLPDGIGPIEACIPPAASRPVNAAALVMGLSDTDLEDVVAEGKRELERRRAKKMAVFLASVRAAAEALDLDSAAVTAALAHRDAEPEPSIVVPPTSRRRPFVRARHASAPRSGAGHAGVSCGGDERAARGGR
jgi:hypothetical protein